MLNRLTFGLPILFAFASSGALIYLYTGAVGNDFAQATSVARNLIEGRFFETSLIFYDVHYKLGPPHVVQTVFPPGYSVLLAPFIVFGISAETAGLTISIVAFLATGALVGACVMRLTLHKWSAAGMASAWYIFGYNWANVLVARSEIVFALAATAAIYAFIRWNREDSGGRRWALAVGIAAACALLLRYQGVFFLASLLVVVLFGYLRDRTRSRLTATVLLLGPGLLSLSLLFGFNRLIAGSLAGGPLDQVSSPISLGNVLLGFYYVFCKLFGVSGQGFFSAEVAEMFLVAFVTTGGIGILSGWCKDRRQVLNNFIPQTAGEQLCALFIVTTVTGLAYLALTKSSGYIQARYVSTLIAPGLIYFGAVLTRVFSCSTKLRPLPVTCMFLCVAFVVTGQRAVIADERIRIESDMRMPTVKSVASEATEFGRLGSFLVQRATYGRFVLANESELLGYWLGIPTFGLPPAEFTGNHYDAATVRDLMERFDVEFLLLMPKLFDHSRSWNRNREIFRLLMIGTPPDWLEKIYESDQVILYERRAGDVDPGH